MRHRHRILGSLAALLLAATAMPSSRAQISPFGIANGTSDEIFLPKSAQAGVKSARLFAYWHDIEPTNDNWDFSTSEDYLTAAQDLGMQLDGFFMYGDSWVGDPEKVFPMSKMDEWKEYVQRTTAQYANRVNYWECWNEPNAKEFNVGDHSAADYATLLSNTYTAAKNGAVGAKVGLSTADYDIRYLSFVLDKGGAGKFDYLCVHPYALLNHLATPNGEARFLTILPSIRHFLSPLNPTNPNFPVWFSEMGATLGGDAEGTYVDESVQASLLVKGYTLAMAQGIQRIHWYEAMPGAQNMGFLNQNLTERKAWKAYKSMTDALGATPTYEGWLAGGGDSGSCCFLFKGKNQKYALIGWTPVGALANQTFYFPVNLAITNILTNTSVSQNWVVMTNTPFIAYDLPANSTLVNNAIANKNVAFPWKSPSVNTNLARITLGTTNVNQGIVQKKASAALPAAGGVGREVAPGKWLSFDVDPTFLSFTRSDVYARVKVKRKATGGGSSWFNFYYYPRSGNPYAGPWTVQNRHVLGDGWFIPDDTDWHVYTTHISNAYFNGGEGENIGIAAAVDAQTFILGSLEVSLVPFTEPMADVYYELAPANANSPLSTVNGRMDVASGGGFNGAQVRLWTSTNSNGQRWKAISVGGGLWEFSPRGVDGRRLDVAGGASADGTVVQVWTPNAAPNASQRWSLIPNSDGTFALAPACAPNKRLDVKNSGTSNGTLLQLWTPNTSAAQKWRLLPK